MMRSKYCFVFIIFFLAIIFGCNVADFFAQPSVDVHDYFIKELPTGYTQLFVKVTVTNNDWRDAYVSDVEYKAVIEGVSSEKMSYKLKEKMIAKQGLKKTFPLLIKTSEAARLLSKLNNNEKLSFKITGNFNVNDSTLGAFTLPLKTSGKAKVTKGIDYFFSQPQIEIINYTVTQVPTVSVFPFLTITGGIKVNADIKVTNKDSHSATLKYVEFISTLGGSITSSKKSETYTPGIALSQYGGGSDSTTLNVTNIEFNQITGIPAFLNYTALLSGQIVFNNPVTVNILGTMLVECDLGNGSQEFYLPLNTTTTVTLTAP